MSKRKRIGFMLLDQYEDFSQPMTLRTGPELPPGGIVDWCSEGDAVFVFDTRKAVRDAIATTCHYKFAFGLSGDVPQIRKLKIVPVECIDPTTSDQEAGE